MAITFYSGKDEQYAICEQTTWGTAATDGAAGHGIHMMGWDFKPTVNVNELNTAKAQRYPKTDDFIVNEKGVLHEIAMPATPFLKDQGDKFLYSVIQNLDSEGTASPYQKTFTLGATQPDFSANGGKFYTLVNKMPVASTSHKISDAILKELTLTCAPGSNNGMLMAEGTWVARNHVENSNYAGTITYPDIATNDIFFFHDLAVKTVAGTAVIIGDEGFKINITNGAIPLGGVSGIPETIRLPFYRVTFTIQALWDATLRTSMSAMRAGGGQAIIIEWGTTGVDGYLSFTMYSKWSATRDLAHAQEGEFVTLTGTCYGTAGSSYPIVVAMANAIDRTW
jgi:hypothetical protein